MIGVQQESQVTVDLWSNDEYGAALFIHDEERHSLGPLSIQYGAHDNVSFEVSEPQTVYMVVDTA